MDKKLLDALNNLSLGLEYLSDILSTKTNEKKSDTSKALMGADVAKKFDELSKSLKEAVDENKKSISKVPKGGGLTEFSKKISQIENSVKNMISSSTKQMINLQKSISETRLDVTLPKEIMNLPQPNPLEIPLRYGKLDPLFLPIPKPIIIELLYGKIPSIPKLPDALVSIDFKFSKLPKLPTLPNLKQSIDFFVSKLPKLPTFENLSVKIDYVVSKLPDTPTIPSIISSIDYMVSELPELPKSVPTITSSIDYVVSKLPKLPEIQNKTVSIDYVVSKLPEIPTIPNINSTIDYVVSKLPELPTYVPGITSTIDYIVSKLPDKPTIPSINSTIDYMVSELPKLPESVPSITSSIDYIVSKLPKLPEIPNITVNIEYLVSRLPDAPTIPSIKSTIDYIVSKLPELPTYIPGITSTINYVVSKLPDAPTIPSINSSIIYIVSSLPELPKSVPTIKSSIDYIVSKLPKLPEIADITANVNYVVSKLPKLPTIESIESTIYYIVSKLPELPTRVPNITSSIDYIVSKLPVLPSIPNIEISIDYIVSRLPELPTTLPTINSNIVYTLADLPTLPTSVPTIESYIFYSISLPKIPTIPSIKASIDYIVSKLPKLPTSVPTIKSSIDYIVSKLPKLPTISSIKASIDYIVSKLPKLPTISSIKASIDYIVSKLPKLPTSVPTIKSSIDYIVSKLPKLPTIQNIKSGIDFVISKLPKLPTVSSIKSSIDYIVSKLPKLPTISSIKSSIDYVVSKLPKLPTVAGIKSTIDYVVSKLPTLPKSVPSLKSTIDFVVSKLPKLPTLPNIKSGIDYIVSKLPKLPTSVPTIKSSIDYVVSKLPKLPLIPPIKSGIKYIVEKLPKLPTVSDIKSKINFGISKLPKLPTIPNIKSSIDYLVSKLPKLPSISSIKSTIDYTVSKLPKLPTSVPEIKSSISYAVSKLPKLPTISNIKSSIDYTVSKLPKPPIVSNIKSTIDYAVSKLPKLPTSVPKIKSTIDFVNSKLPKLPKVPSLKSSIDFAVSKLPSLPKVPNLKSSIDFVNSKLPKLPKVPSLKSSIDFAVSKLPKLPSLPKLPKLNLGFSTPKLPKLPSLPKMPDIGLKFGKPKVPTIPQPKPVEVEVKYKKVPPRTVEKQAKSDKESGMFGFFGKSGDPKETKSIKSGIKLIILIAAGVLAIGLALKIVGGVNFASVLGLALAISVLTVAFAKLAENKNLTAGRAAGLTAVLVGISLAVMLSSFILGAVRPVGIIQMFTAIMIAGMFTVLSYGLGKLLLGISRITGKGLLMVPLLPFIMVGISMAIAASSLILGMVKPVGLFQMITAILIAGMFSVVSYGLGNLLSGLSKLGLKSIALIPLLPMVLVAISAAIVGSSYLLAAVKPIGLFQAITAIMIAAVFAVVGYGLGKLLKGFEGISESKAIVIAAIMPILLVAMSAAIMGSSYLLALTKPVGLFQLLTALMIAIVFIPISFAIPYVTKGIQNVNPAKMALVPIILVAMALTIMLSSYILAEIKIVPFNKLVNAVGISIVMGIIGIGMSFVLDRLSKYSPKKMFEGAINLVIIAAAVVATSLILAKGEYTKYPSITWIFFAGLAMVGFGFAIYLLDKMKLGISKVIEGGLSLIAIAGTIYATSLILSKGDYTKYPSFNWLLYTASSMVAYGFAIFLLNKIGLSISQAIQGGIAILAIAATVLATSLILSKGDYSKYPSLDWTLNTAAAMIPFGIAAVLLGTIATSGVGAVAIAAGLVAIIAVAGTILAVDAILSKGNFSKGVPLQWTLTTAAAMVPFGLAAVLLGPLLPLVTIGAVAILAVAATVLATDKILSYGQYSKYPTIEWSKAVGLTLGEFALGMGALGAIIAGTLGLGAVALAAGAAAVLGIAETVVQTSNILSKGNYAAGPTVAWASGVALSLSAFSNIYKMLLANSVMSLFGKGDVGPKAFSESVVTVANAIVEASNKLATGKFTGGPSVQWASGVAIALGAFSQIYKMLVANAIFDLFGGGIGPKEFGESIVTVSKAINTAALELSTGKFVGGPKKEWAQGVAIALGAFSSVYKMLLDNAGPSFFRSGVTPEQFSTAIVTISKGIKSAAFELAQGETNYKKGPTKEWAEGVSLALGGFAPIYKILADNAGVWKSGVSVDDFKNAIESISKGIKTAASELAKGEQNYKKGPTKEWAEGVSLSLQAFTGIFQALGANSGWFTGGLKPEDYQNAIKSVGMGLAEAAKAISADGVSYDLGKVPKKEWGQAISDTFKTFIPVLQYISEQSGFFSDGAEDTVNNMAAISKAVADTSITIKGGDYTTIIDPKWSNGLSSTFKVFVSILKDVIGDDDMDDYYANVKSSSNVIVAVSTILSRGNYREIPATYMPSLKTGFTIFLSILKTIENAEVDDDNMKSTKDLASNLQSVSIILSRGNFTKIIPKAWMDSVRTNLVVFSQMIKGFSSGGFFSVFDDSTSEKVTELANGIIQLATIFNNNKVPFDIKKVPSIQWSQGFSTAMNAIMPGLNYISQNDSVLKSGEEKFKSGISAIADGIVIASRKLATGRFDKVLNPTYFKNLSDSTKIFADITKSLDEADLDYDSVSDMADSMVELAKAYDRLAEALTKLNGQLGSVDMERMTMLKNLSGSIVLLSLMDATQFESMMTSLESKAKIFVDVMKDTKESAPAGMESKTTTPPPTEVKPGTKPVTGQNVKTPTTTKPKQTAEDQMKGLTEAITALNGIVSSIAGVIVGGSKDGKVSLQEYLNAKKKEKSSLIDY